MVITRSRSGEAGSRHGDQNPPLVDGSGVIPPGEPEDPSNERIIPPGEQRNPSSESGTTSGGTTSGGTTSGGTTSGGTTSDGTTITQGENTEQTVTQKKKENIYKEKSVGSGRSEASRKRLLAELEAKERLAQLKLKQIQAETQLEEARLDRRRAEFDSTDDEDQEDLLAPTRINDWLARKPGNEQPHVEEKTQEQGKEVRIVNEKEPEKQWNRPNVPLAPTQPMNIDVAALTAALTEATRSAPREPPKYLQDLPVYNGSSTEWLSFKAAYRDTQHYFWKNENIARIRRSIRGLAKEAVSSLLVGQTDPQLIMEALERRFGRPDTLILMEMDKLRALHKLTESPRDLCIFAGKIANTVCTVEALQKTQYLHNPEMTRLILDKLTPILRNKWYDYSARKEDIPDLKKIATFLNEEADKCGPYATPETITDETAGGGKERGKRKIERTYTADTSTSRKEDGCPACKQEHKLPDCPQFLGADTNARWEIAKKSNTCYRCLRSKHRRFMCKAPPCGHTGCQMRHHRLLHHVKKIEDSSQNKAPQAPEAYESITSTVETITSTGDRPRRAYLKIAPVVIKGPLTSIETYALLDEGSTVTIVDASIADVLGIDGPVNTMWVQGVGTEVKHERSKTVSLQIRGRHETTVHTIKEARTVNRLDFSPQTISEEDIRDCVHLKDIENDVMYDRASPKLLIGQDNWNLITTRQIRAGRRDQPVASYTQLGWVLHGCRTSLTDTVAFCGHLTTKERTDPMEEMMKDYFKLESLCIEPRTQKSDPEQRALKILKEKSQRLPDGRYETGLLWREDDITIPNNYRDAQKRLHTLEKKLDRNEDLKEKYKERMNNLLTSGYAERATTPPQEGKTWYLPHFPVINAAKPNKPPRLVHDASAKTAGISLNDMLLPGPDLLQSLPGVIMRFRQYPCAVSADIKEMFMQIKIREEDRDALRFLWRNDRREGAPEEYRMTSVIFGATSSPCTALYIKDRNANDFANVYPDAAEAIKKNHYMDDYLQSFTSIPEAVETAKAVYFIHKQAGFVLSDWASNEKSVKEELAEERDSASTVNIGGKETEKTLGLIWNIKKDCFEFRVNTRKTPPEILVDKRPPTKREALSVIMALFDPLGLVSPITTPAKRILQDAWRYKTDWDEPIPEELQSRWSTWISSLRAIKDLRIPRCYDYERVATRQLHTFVDASEEAYAAAVYWRTERTDGTVHVTLAAGKSRVTPLKPISIPRLELQAALLGARLTQTVLREHDYDVASKTYWSDSRTALAWIRAEPRTFKTFVAHRLAEIEDTTKKDEWRWLSSNDNVADDATRATPSDFKTEHRWFYGPDFLKLPENQWPQETKTAVNDTGEERERCHATSDELGHAHLPDIEKFSRWTKLIRTTARVLQFINLCRSSKATVAAARRKRTVKNAQQDPDWRQTRKKVTKYSRPVTTSTSTRYINLPAHYLIKAEKLWICASQEDSYANEKEKVKRGIALNKDSQLAALSLYIDTEDTLRLRGRVTAAQEIEENAANPPILDGHHKYTRLYIQHVHEKLHHGGVEMVVNELRQQLWLVRIRPAVRDVIKHCLLCRIKRKKPSSPSTGNLPAARLAHHARPFTYTGVDYFGPIEVTVARHHEKRYGALFTCMTSRAIHIEIAHSLSADSAIAALRRFIARRGCPTEMWSDNATCFKAAERELGEAALEALEEETTGRRITWRYIPPAAPFMGGAWERMVRAVKEALRVTLHERYPSDETLATLLAEVENTVNSRPLTHVAVTPEEPEALTPNHILIGPNCHTPAPGRFDQQDLTARQHWRRAQALADIFWRRWVREYLPLLQHRREPYRTGANPKVGDLVVICDSNLPRNTWPRGRISQVYPGQDGEVRVVDVTVSGGHVLRRPTKKIVVLPVESQDCDGGRNVHDDGIH